MTYGNLGAICLMQGKSEESFQLIEKALQLQPNDPDAQNNLGIALRRQGNLSAAVECHNKALQLKPNFPEALNNLGIALREQGDTTAAIALCNKALQLSPDYVEAHNNLGICLHEQGDLTAAIDSYNKAIELKPDHVEAHWNSSLAILLSGDYKNGWERYEWRARRNKKISNPHAMPTCKRWDRKQLELNTKLLLVSEQGLGDTIQFMRYVHELRQRGWEVSLCAQSQLHTLIQESDIDHSPLTPHEAELVSEGKWVPLLSVPSILGVSPCTPIRTSPYIKANDSHVKKWAKIMRSQAKPVIGINWQGNPEAEKTWLRGRSLPLEFFASIASLENISLVSLQKGAGSEQLESCSFKDNFVSYQNKISETWDFLETAAIIANCDLVITSDTSIAHLAGGMGKNTWVLLHKVPDWRWGLKTETSFWYPTMRLFRQTEPDNWSEVMERVRDALRNDFGSDKSSIQPSATS